MSIDKLGASEIALSHLQQNAETNKAAAAGARRPDAQPKSQPAPDQLSLSDEARAMAAARQAVSNAPDVREDKVAAIKQRIEDGTYSVSPRVLAQKIFEHVTGQGA